MYECCTYCSFALRKRLLAIISHILTSACASRAHCVVRIILCARIWNAETRQPVYCRLRAFGAPEFTFCSSFATNTELSSSSSSPLDSTRLGAPLVSALLSYRRGTASGHDSTRPLICMRAPRASASTSASSASVMIVASITDDKNCIDGRICFREPPPPVSSRFSR